MFTPHLAVGVKPLQQPRVSSHAGKVPVGEVSINASGVSEHEGCASHIWHTFSLPSRDPYYRLHEGHEAGRVDTVTSSALRTPARAPMAPETQSAPKPTPATFYAEVLAPGQLGALRNPPCSVLQCMQSILLVPPNHQLLEIPHIIQRALTWNPREHELNSLYDAVVLQEPLQQVAAGDDAEEHAMPVEGVFNDMLKKLQTMKRDRSEEGSEMDLSNADSRLLAIKSATASEAYSEHFRAENAIRDDGREWAIPTGSENSITYTLELDEPKEILGLGLAHRVEPQWKFFKQCYVQMPGRHASENKLTFTESREVQIAMLQKPFTSSRVEIKFLSDQISTGEGTPGLRGIMLIGCDSAEGGEKKRRT